MPLRRRSPTPACPALPPTRRITTPRRRKLRATATVLMVLHGVTAAADAGAAARKRATAAVPVATSSTTVAGYAGRSEVMRFAEQLAQRHELDATWVLQQLAQARFVPAVTRLIMPPAPGVAKDWAAYRARFVESRRIEAGLAFWNAHQRWLLRAQALYGVPPEIVVGILGVETFYGRHTGHFRVIDALATLAFDFPDGRSDRSAFFRGEIEALLVHAASQRIAPASLKGSYAGAIGLPQFMPSSIERYAIDFDADGRVDLLGSPADAIGSVAHYLAEFGWSSGLPTHYEVDPPADAADRDVLLEPDIEPRFSAAEFAERGAALPPEGRLHRGLLALVELQNGDAAPSYVAGTSNFYTLTRYNRSSYYALAVIELGAAIARRRDATDSADAPVVPASADAAR